MFKEEFRKVITGYPRETVRKEVIFKSYKEFRKVFHWILKGDNKERSNF